LATAALKPSIPVSLILCHGVPVSQQRQEGVMEQVVRVREAGALSEAEAKELSRLTADAANYLRRDAAASWRVIVRKPCDGWD
jgi:hypothetical protein